MTTEEFPEDTTVLNTWTLLLLRFVTYHLFIWTGIVLQQLHKTNFSFLWLRGNLQALFNIIVSSWNSGCHPLYLRHFSVMCFRCWQLVCVFGFVVSACHACVVFLVFCLSVMRCLKLCCIELSWLLQLWHLNSGVGRINISPRILTHLSSYYLVSLCKDTLWHMLIVSVTHF